MLVRFHPLVRLIVAVFCVALATTFMAATPPPVFSKPTLVIFPYRLAPGVDSLVGTTYIERLSGALIAQGGINVIMGDVATAPADYLHVTKTDGGDFYMIGYIATPLNRSAAVIEQIVSARSGTVVWSNTAAIAAEEDVLAQGPIVRKGLLSYVSRGFDSIPITTPRPATPPPAPKRAGPAGGAVGPDGAPLLPNEAYGFSSKPTAPPKVYASANRPSRFVVLAITGSTQLPAVRDYAANSLISALKHHGQAVAQGDPETTEFPAVRGHDICTQTGAGYLVFGSVTGSSVKGTDENNYLAHTDADLSLLVFDCAAQKLNAVAKSHGRAGKWEGAIDRAADTASNYVLKVANSAKSS
jgi:hypothetical protein